MATAFSVIEIDEENDLMEEVDIRTLAGRHT
jgi:hypothetical protein